MTEELAGLSESRLVAYHRPREWVQNYYARTPTVPSELRIELGSPFDVFRKPGFLYLWMPGQ